MRDRRSDAHRDVAARTFGILKSGTDVDHVDGDKENNAPANLNPLPHAVHSTKTARTVRGPATRKLAAALRKVAGTDKRKLY